MNSISESQLYTTPINRITKIGTILINFIIV
jgi:hypothetical protein